MVKISPRINSRHILLHLSYSRFHVLSSFCAISLAEALAHSTMVGSNSLRIPSIDHIMSDRATSLKFPLPMPDDTDRLATCVANIIRETRDLWVNFGLVLAFDGDLGAGKTTFARAMLRAWGFAGAVKSPTFSLVETYPILGVTMNHFDFYRFETPYEFDDAGFRDLFGAGQICITEWTEKAQPFVPQSDIELRLTIDGLGRIAELEALSSLGETLLKKLGEQ